MITGHKQLNHDIFGYSRLYTCTGEGEGGTYDSRLLIHRNSKKLCFAETLNFVIS